MTFPVDPKTGEGSDILTWLRKQGLNLQPQRHIRDQEEIFTTLLDAIFNDLSYVGKVQHLAELYGAAMPEVTQATAKKIQDAFDGVGNEMPSYKTAITEVGTFGHALVVEQSKDQLERSHLPLNSPEHYKEFMGSEKENSHMRLYFKLVLPLGDVIHDLVAKEILPRRFASKLRKPDLSDVKAAMEALDAARSRPPTAR